MLLGRAMDARGGWVVCVVSWCEPESAARDRDRIHNVPVCRLLGPVDRVKELSNLLRGGWVFWLCLWAPPVAQGLDCGALKLPHIGLAFWSVCGLELVFWQGFCDALRLFRLVQLPFSLGELGQGVLSHCNRAVYARRQHAIEGCQRLATEAEPGVESDGVCNGPGGRAECEDLGSGVADWRGTDKAWPVPVQGHSE